MPELNVMESPKVAGFVDSKHSNANRRRAEKEEKEIEELMESRQEEQEEQEVVVVEAPKEAASNDDDKDLTREEKTYKKRYDDLRRHQNKLVEQVKTLEAQVSDPSSFAAPTTELS